MRGRGKFGKDASFHWTELQSPDFAHSLSHSLTHSLTHAHSLLRSNEADGNVPIDGFMVFLFFMVFSVGVGAREFVVFGWCARWVWLGMHWWIE